jgi:uncharacterized protein YjdB
MKLRITLLFALLWTLAGEAFADIYHEGLYYAVNANGTLTVTGVYEHSCWGNPSYHPPVGDIVIPDTVGQYKVTEIRSLAGSFEPVQITSVTIPATVESISEGAFSSCGRLTSIKVKGGSYESVDGVLYTSGRGTLLQYPRAKEGASFTVSASTTRIADFACGGARFTSVHLPNSLRSIGVGAFGGSAITSLVLPPSLESIPNYAFQWCSNLTTIILSNSVTSIGAFAFSGSGLTSADIQGSVASIGNNAFEFCGSLTKVTMGRSVTSIGEAAFRYCEKLASVDIPKSVTYIGPEAFRGCSELQWVTVEWLIPLELNINHRIFHFIHSECALIVPPGTEALYKEAPVWKSFRIADPKFLNVTTDQINFPSSSGTIGIWIKSNVNWTVTSSAAWVTVSPASGSNDGSSIVTFQANTSSSPRTATITVTGDGLPPQTISVTQAASSGGGENNSNFEVVNHVLVRYHGAGGAVVIPADMGITAIGKEVFMDNHTLTSVVIPAGVTEIGEYAFMNCINLASVTFPNTLSTIKSGAFLYCLKLTTVTIPASVTQIETSALSGCEMLTAILVDEQNPIYTSVDGVLYGYNETQLHTFPSGKGGTFTMPTTVKIILYGAFLYAWQLTDLTIPNSVTYIDAYAFYYAINLTSISIPASVTTIWNSAFEGCVALKDVTVGWANPLSVPATVFNDINISEATLHVPKGTRALYQAADVWQSFGTIREASAEIIRPTAVALNYTSLSRTAGDPAVLLVATVLPDSASNKAVIWSTSDPSVATVTNGTVNFIGAGTAVITVTTVDDNRMAICIVTVAPYASAELANIPQLKAFAARGIMHIAGLRHGESLCIYNLSGRLVYKGIATAEEMHIPLGERGIFIISAGKRSLKTIHNE